MTDELSKKIKKRLRSMVHGMVTDYTSPQARYYEDEYEIGLQDRCRIQGYLDALYDTGVITKKQRYALGDAARKLHYSCDWSNEGEHHEEYKKHLLQLIKEM